MHYLSQQLAGVRKPPAAVGGSVCKQQACVAAAARHNHAVRVAMRMARWQLHHAGCSDSDTNMQTASISGHSRSISSSSGGSSMDSSGGGSSNRGDGGSSCTKPLSRSSTARRAVLGVVAAAAAAASSSLSPLPIPFRPPPAAAAAVSAPSSTSSTECALQTSSSGLRWCDLRVGEGPAAIKGAFIKTHHTAALASNGSVFDSSYAKKQPLVWKAGEREVMEAWDKGLLGEEGLPAMCEGGVRRLVVPPGPLQRQGTKSLTWVVGLLDALEESGEAVGVNGSPTTDWVFDIELLAKKRK